MLTLMISMVLAAPPAPVADPVWTIAPDGSMVALVLGTLSVVVEKPEPTRTLETEEAKHHGPKLVTLIDLPRRGTTLKRLPGPTWWRCPSCYDSTCLMYLGAHLTNPRSHHRIPRRVVNGISWQTLKVYHDNLHNAKVAPKPVVVRQVVPEYCPQCQQNRRPTMFRIFRRSW